MKNNFQSQSFSASQVPHESIRVFLLRPLYYKYVIICLRLVVVLKKPYNSYISLES